MKREFVKFPIADFIALLCVIALIWAFLQMPWSSTTRKDTGIELLSEIQSDMEMGISDLWLLPIAIMVGGLATAAGLVRVATRKISAGVICLAGVSGLLYYGIVFVQNNPEATNVSAFGYYGFWLAMFAFFGLAAQIVIPRTPHQVSIADVNLWALLPFDVNLKNREAVAAYIFLAPFLIFFSIFVVRAVILAVQMSFHNWLILPPKSDFIGIDNYIELFNDDVWWIALQNTFIFAVLTVVGTTIVALLSALAVTRPVFGQGFFRVLLYMPSLFSVGAVGLIWVWLLNSQYGVINYGLSFLGVRPINWLGNPSLVLPSLSLTTIWWNFGFPMLIFIAGLQGIPEQLYEAARIDGASPTQIFFNITLPLLRPTILFVTVTGVISHFQVYGQPFIMTNGGPGRSSYTVIFYLYQIAWTAFRMGYGAAVAVAIALIMAVMTVLQFFFIGRRVEF